jgi:hypothetical protein
MAPTHTEVNTALVDALTRCSSTSKVAELVQTSDRGGGRLHEGGKEVSGEQGFG